MRRAAPAALAVAAARPAAGTMYDAISPELLPPLTCKNGCAAWSTKDTNIWQTGKVPASANRSCAQPGKVVNAHPKGPWCYCDNGAPTPPPGPSSQHPLAGRAIALKNVANSYYLSFAYSAHPAGVDQGAGKWMRVDYTAATDAMPLQMHAVDGKANTYTMYNLYTGYEGWVSVTNNYMSAHADAASALQLQFVATGVDGDSFPPGGSGYKVVDQKGQYVTTDDSTWAETTASADDAMVFTVEDAVGPGADAGSGDTGYCTHGDAVPEQINIQAATQDAVVVSFVTFESTAPKSAPTLLIGADKGDLKPIQGVTHVHTTAAKDRTYYMHFIRASGLTARGRYYYQVRSGGSGATTSSVFSFRAPYASGETKVDIYGDMGVYDDNNMLQLEADCATGSSADVIVHMGDHAYNEGDYDEARADGYFNAFQQTLGNCPWIPVVGNHEYYAGAQLGRYLDSTWQKWGPIAGGDVAGNEFALGPHKSTATSALGAMLSTGLHHGAGTMGANPSGTSRYFSVDFGLIHLVALDLNMYFGVDPCGDPCKQAQLAWLEKDLAAANANRGKVPWVAAFSHYPLYCSGCNTAQVSAQYYASDAAERWGNINLTAAGEYERDQAMMNLVRLKQWQQDHPRLHASSDAIIADFVPIFDKYGVDIYLAGHWHYYESVWPSTPGDDDCKTCSKPIQKDFNKPSVTVHVTTGAGGPGGTNGFCYSGAGSPDCPIPSARKQSSETGYGRMIAHNATHLTFQQYLNKDSSLFDQWTIYQPKHPFSS